MTLSALQTQVMVVVMVTPLRLNALIWRFGALGYDSQRIAWNVLGYFADISQAEGTHDMHIHALTHMHVCTHAHITFRSLL
jgi:hypothetical protein